MCEPRLFLSLLRWWIARCGKDSGVPRFRGHCGPPRLAGLVNSKDHRIAIHQLSSSHLVTMSTPRAVLRSASAVARLEPCLSCRSRQTTLAIRYNATRYPMASHWLATGMRTQNYSINRKLDPKARVEVDTRARLGFYTICKQQSVLNIEPRTALSIYNDFVAKTKTTSHSDNVLRIVESRFAAHTPLYSGTDMSRIQRPIN